MAPTKRAHTGRVAEPYLGFRRMDVHVERRCRQGQEQCRQRIAAARQRIAVPCPHRAKKRAVLNRPAFTKERFPPQSDDSLSAGRYAPEALCRRAVRPYPATRPESPSDHIGQPPAGARSSFVCGARSRRVRPSATSEKPTSGEAMASRFMMSRHRPCSVRSVFRNFRRAGTALNS